MKCPKCKHDKSRVLRTEKYDDIVDRKRICCKCNYIWRTFEEIDHDFNNGKHNLD